MHVVNVKLTDKSDNALSVRHARGRFHAARYNTVKGCVRVWSTPEGIYIYLPTGDRHCFECPAESPCTFILALVNTVCHACAGLYIYQLITEVREHLQA